MPLNVKILSLIFIIAFAVIIFLVLRKGRISLKYSIIWYACLFVLLLFTIFPEFLRWLTGLIGIQIPSNFIFAFMLGVLFVICLFLTMIVSEQNEKIRRLLQEMSIIKEKLRDKDEKND